MCTKAQGRLQSLGFFMRLDHLHVIEMFIEIKIFSGDVPGNTGDFAQYFATVRRANSIPIFFEH